MFALNKKTDYGLIALTCLAAEPGEVFSARQIAGRYGIRLPVLTNVLKTLQAGGIIDSIRGSRGGYRLARPAEEITLAELVYTIEGPSRPRVCLREAGEDWLSCCDLAQHCPVHSPVRKVHLKLMKFLETITLKDLIGKEYRIEETCVSG